jgi:O-antigen/teichoic acid export membrane protein
MTTMEATPPRDLLDTPEAGPAAIRGGALRVGGFAAGVALSVVSAALLFRHLGVEDSGRYVTALALVAIVQGVTDAGLTALGMRELATRNSQAQAVLMRNLLGLRLVLTSAGVVCVTIFAAGVGYEDAMVVGTFLAGVGLVVQNLQGTLAVSLMTRLRLGLVTAAELLRQFVSVVLVVVLVVAGAGLVSFLAVPIPAAVASLVLTAALVHRQVPLLPSLDRREWWLLLRDTVPFAVATAVNVVYFRTAIVLMSLVATAEETGIFATSFRVVEILVAVPALAVSTVFPIYSRAARDDPDRLRYVVARTFEGSLVLGVGMALTLALGAEVAIDVIGGDEYKESVGVLRIQALVLPAAFATAAWGFALLSLHAHRALLVVNLVAFALAAGLTAVLAATEGAEGAAVATVAGEVGLALACAIALTRRERSLRPPLALLPRVALAAAAGAAPALIPGLPPLVLAAVGGAIYLAVLILLRAVPRELIDEAARLLRRGRAGPSA